MPVDPKAKKPDWLRVRAPGGENFNWLKEVTKAHGLHTVCEEARCPNIGECWAGGTATFMILGGVCTRGCKFCEVTTGNPKKQLDPHEPEKIAKVVRDMKLSYIVLTSVDRDDLPDQGANHFKETVVQTKLLSPGLLVETLTPDWRGDDACIDIMVEAGVDVLAHNIETVERLQRHIRDPRCGYEQSLKVLREYKLRSEKLGRRVLTKSSIMVGLGETESEILQTMKDLRTAGVSVLTIGQYLQPSQRRLPVEEFITPETFSKWAKMGEELGFLYVASGPLVRSSYRAGEYFIEKILRGEQSGGEIMRPLNQTAESVQGGHRNSSLKLTAELIGE
jgi:lipoyl synthase